MRKMKLLLMSALFFFGMQTVNAQLSFGADFSGLRGFEDGSEFMFGAGINGRIGITDNLFVGANIGFYQKSENVPFFGKISSRIIPVTISGEYHILTENIRPYLGLDLGLYSFAFSFLGVSDSESRLGLAPVGGIQIGVNDNIFLNANTKFHAIFDNDVNNFWSFNIGIGYRL